MSFYCRTAIEAERLINRFPDCSCLACNRLIPVNNFLIAANAYHYPNHFLCYSFSLIMPADYVPVVAMLVTVPLTLSPVSLTVTPFVLLLFVSPVAVTTNAVWVPLHA